MCQRLNRSLFVQSFSILWQNFVSFTKKGSYYRYTIKLQFLQKNLTFLLHIYSELEILGYIKYLAHINGPLE